ncbi:2-amino-4-hydroxy-6-hydroxymethyldihydropteridine diphosphokinase [Rhabdonatronobacter sediminivivens]
MALGGNMPTQTGSPNEVITRAIGALKALAVGPVRSSRLYRTPAFPPGSGPDFVNAAAAFRTTLAAPELLQRLHEIEHRAGRQRRNRWGARTLDLDLLALDDLVCPDVAGFRAWADLPVDLAGQSAPQQLILPHPRLHERGFVLVPLADVAPDWVHPVFGQDVRRMCAALSPTARAEVVALDAESG